MCFGLGVVCVDLLYHYVVVVFCCFVVMFSWVVWVVVVWSVLFGGLFFYWLCFGVLLVYLVLVMVVSFTVCFAFV